MSRLMENNLEDVLKALKDLNDSYEVSIIKLSEPFTIVNNASNSDGKRDSDVSTSGLEGATPASLEADLTHYKVDDSFPSVLMIFFFY
jgi:hypothetical protein